MMVFNSGIEVARTTTAIKLAKRLLLSSSRGEWFLVASEMIFKWSQSSSLDYVQTDRSH